MRSLHSEARVVARRNGGDEQRGHRLDVGGQRALLLQLLPLQRRLLAADAELQVRELLLGRGRLGAQRVELLASDAEDQLHELADVQLPLDAQLDILTTGGDALQRSHRLVRRASQRVLQRDPQLPNMERAAGTLLEVRLKGALHRRARPNRSVRQCSAPGGCAV